MAMNEQNTGADAKLESLRIEPARKLPKRTIAGTLLVLFAGVVVGLAIAVGVLSSKQAKEAQAKEDAAKTAKDVATAKQPDAKAGDVILTATGYVTPRRRISLSPQVSGVVKWVGIEKGQAVKEGDVLVRLDDDQYKARLAQAEADAESAKAHLEMVTAGNRKQDIAMAAASLDEAKAMLTQTEKTLTRVNAAQSVGIEKQRIDEAQGGRDMAQARLNAAQSQLDLLNAGYRQEDIDAAAATYKSATAAADLARIQMNDTVITAPSSGTILEKLIEVGELVSPQNFGGTRGARSELLSLADLSDLQVEVDINESDFEKIRPNNGAKVFLDAYPKRAYEAYIREIAPEADRQKATIQVKVAIKTPDEFTRPEMSARVDFLKME